MKNIKKEALNYHSKKPAGKTSIKITKKTDSAKDLALAYTPGVAEPVKEIAAKSDNAYKYTNRGNLVGIVSNGTAILGLGNKGALASKPVMEGKAVLFKKFADVDAFDIEINETDPDKVVEIVKTMEPTFGGINLEDIKAPECFEIEEKLKQKMNIPVFHDDQHGTAIVACAGLINALELSGKKIGEVKIVLNGAGAAGIAIAKFLITLGAQKRNITMCDSKGVIYKGRKVGVNKYKLEFARGTKLRTLNEAMVGADVFIGISVKDLLTPAMLRSMADSPIVFALANPDPEIKYEVAKKARKDVIFATGRSDYPNQVNNVLGFPYIFRGALDARASKITNGMMKAACMALSKLARETVPASVARCYCGKKFKYGPEYILPKPMDPRLKKWVAGAVRKAAK